MMLTGNHAAAYAAKLARVEVIPLYPITPQTSIVEKITEFITNGELDAECCPAESEHSVMAVATAAAATGARVFTASSSHGVAFMHENLFAPPAMRLPMVMAIANRAMGPPQDIYDDHSDSLAQRDTGWIQVYTENAQETLDAILQGYRIAEDERVLLPVHVCFDGLKVSHFLERVELPSQSEIDDFLGEYEPHHVFLNPKKPMHIGEVCDHSYYMEYRYQQKVAMDQAIHVIQEVSDEYGKRLGRKKEGGLVQTFFLEDAEVALLTMGSISGLARNVIRRMREDGVKIGLIKLRVFRPFPQEELREIACHLKMIVTIDKNVSLGMSGIVHSELATSLYGLESKPLLLDYIAGLGGRFIFQEDLEKMIKEAFGILDKGTLKDPIRWYGVRGT